MSAIYLDNNSTTKIDPIVAEIMGDCYRNGYANPASQHRCGQAARSELERLRRSILENVGGTDRRTRLIFTSGGTEANNLALLGAVDSVLSEKKRRVVVSAVEHPSVHGPAERLSQLGYEVVHLSVDSNGIVDLQQLEHLVQSDNETALVSIMLVNNETGVIQPVQRAAEICRQQNVPFHCDAVQAIGKIELSFENLGVAAMSISAHKLHGPRGIGGLIVDESLLELQPIFFGGFQQLGQRPGTEDVALAAGFSKCIELANQEFSDRTANMRDLRDQFESLIQEENDGVVVNGADADRAPHTSNLSFPGVDRQALLLAVDAAGVSVSTGSACASGSSDPSPVLIAMHCSAEVIQGSIRVSLCATTTRTEIELAASRITKAVKHLRRHKSFRKSS